MDDLQSFYDALHQIIKQYTRSKISPDLFSKFESTHEDYQMLNNPSADDLVKNLIDTGQKRAELLAYLLYMIHLIEPVICGDNHLKDTVSWASFQSQLLQFILNLKNLLNTSESQSMSITYNGEAHTIIGFLNNVSHGSRLSDSGQLIKNELFLKLFPESILTADDFPWYAELHVSNLIKAQGILILPEQNEAQRLETQALQSKIDVQHSENQALQLKNDNLNKWMLQKSLALNSITLGGWSIGLGIFSLFPAVSTEQTSDIDIEKLEVDNGPY